MRNITGWNGQPHILIGIDNYIDGSHAVRHYRNGSIIARFFDSNNAWTGTAGKLSDAPLDLRPGDQLNLEGRNTGGPGAFYFNYTNEQGLQLGIDTSTMWTWYVPSGDQGNFTDGQIADGYGGMSSFKNSWHAGQIKVQHGDQFKGPNFYNQATYKVFVINERNKTHGFWLTVPPYDQWVGYVGDPTTPEPTGSVADDPIGILHKGSVNNMSIGDASPLGGNRINKFKNIKTTTTENSETIMSEMRDWLRVYSANINGFQTGDGFSFGEFSDSIIWGVKIAVENESGRYANTNDGKISVEGLHGSGDWGGVFKFTLQGNGVYKSATTAGRHTFTNLGGTAKSSVNYVYRLNVQDVTAGNNLGFDIDVTVGYKNAGSEVTSVTSSSNSFNKIDGQAEVITFTGQNVSGMSDFLSVLCKPRDV